jgi:hypothetical protein
MQRITTRVAAAWFLWWCRGAQLLNQLRNEKQKGECYGVQLPQATVHDAAMYGDEVEWLRPD